MHIRSFIALVSVLLIFSQSFSVYAISVFQWVDSEGVTHFSDETPVDGTAVEQLSNFEVDENYPQGRDPEEDYFSIINQWKRTNDERGARDSLRQANRQNIQILRQQPPPLYNDQPSQRYYTGLLSSPYSYNRGQGHHRNHFQNRSGTLPREQSQPRPVPGYIGNVAGSNPGSN